MTISDEGHIVYEGIKYQTLDIKVADTLPLADYPKEKYLEDYDSTLADYLNEDGTLKPHKRFISEGSRETEDAEASFVIVTTRLSNTGNETKDVYLSPFLRYLDANDDGSYTLSREKSWPAEESWALHHLQQRDSRSGRVFRATKENRYCLRPSTPAIPLSALLSM